MSNLIAEALADVDNSFKHLEFAIRLMCYTELGHLNLEQLDCDLLIDSDHELLKYLPGRFQNIKNAITSSQALVSIAFGTSALVLDAAFEIAGIKKNIGSTTQKDELRRLVYMIRCAFAHNPAMPLWNARGKEFSRPIKLEIFGDSLAVDVQHLNNSSFEYKHIGGFGMWEKIRNASIALINDTQPIISNTNNHHEQNFKSIN